jgi:DhnA family fructose-bisphosphate aldolase class Ia
MENTCYHCLGYLGTFGKSRAKVLTASTSLNRVEQAVAVSVMIVIGLNGSYVTLKAADEVSNSANELSLPL